MTISLLRQLLEASVGDGKPSAEQAQIIQGVMNLLTGKDRQIDLCSLFAPRCWISYFNGIKRFSSSLRQVVLYKCIYSAAGTTHTYTKFINLIAG